MIMNLATLNLTKLTMQPFPHIFINDFLLEDFRISLRNSFSCEVFKTAEGGCPVSNIGDKSASQLQNFMIYDVLNNLVPKLDYLFKSEIENKYHELVDNYKQVTLFDSAKFGFFHLTKNIPGSKINSHRDDDRATYQFIFFLGDAFDQEIETTELIYVTDIETLERTGDTSLMEIKNFGKSKNGFLCFANTPDAYHCLSKTILFERFTIAASVIHYDCN